MKRRNFNKLLLSAIGGTLITPVIANSIKVENGNVRLGGPVFRKYKNPDEWISAINELNYKAAYCPVKIGASSEEIRDYKGAALKSDIVISEVGAWSNPIDPDSEKSKTALEKCIKSLQLADEIGANCCVNISGSRNPEKWAGPHKDNLTPVTFDLIVETTRKIIDAVNPKSTFYTLETMPWSYPDSVESYERLFKAIDRKQFGVHFDPVNLVISPQVYYKNGEMIKEAFKKLGPFIRSCHAKDILLLDEKLTPHLPEVRPGLGNLNYAIFLKELAKLKNIPLMMEHLNSAEEYNKAVGYIRSVGKENNIIL
ncbi:MAG: sugar phosphate isomerase/epimerase [Prolixibacteraceae bacterium]|jgi:sugar phosphate isomerase/epimerase|nr:sugar phosphate isomerase/epimerase [Prolixibacteraceae bacterium]MBT6006846.1 sugar phosphate isomerase/epimerase [Prolixibacteraceae bacterium]MBT6764867.1 sugar phosphate isomerase/epimerase [Prolixibacteraceae bacterium]MBT6997109.1 sugar phosphate isomerase/epimerase [Prolixibacteraceae bacterium]MBT7393358.1 sugar phosphate isomerase/epimerase [Prolixibacteraceae bacterium]